MEKNFLKNIAFFLATSIQINQCGAWTEFAESDCDVYK